MPKSGDELVAIIRQIVREEVADAILAMNRADTSLPPKGVAQEVQEAVLGICGATDDRGFVCQKPPHRGRHKFTVRRQPPPPRNWEPITEATIQSGSRKYQILPGNPVKVMGLGRAGAAGDGYKVVSMERHTETGEVNVEVMKEGRGQRSRVVKLDRIVYKRPRKG